MADNLKPDLCIIGAGALGISLAISARARGMSVVLVNRGPEPGDAEQGALAAAAFRASATTAETIRTAGKFGLDNAAPKPNFRAISEHAAALAATVAPRDAEERLLALGVTCLAGEALFADGKTLKLGDTVIKARHFIVAAGAPLLLPAIPGLDQVSFFTPDTILDNLRKLSHLVVIGGDATALELAQSYRRLGSTVTLVPQGEILPGFDRELVGQLLRRLAEEGVAVLEGASVSEIVPRSQGTGVKLKRADGSEDALDVSHILVSMGRQPELDAPWLAGAKLRRDKANPDRLELRPGGQTSQKAISVLGGIAGDTAPHLAEIEGERLLDRLLGSAKGQAPLPRLVTTDPPLAEIGLLENGKPLAAGQVVLRSSLAENEAARALMQARGTAKLVVDAHGKIIGGALLGPGAGDMIAILAMAMLTGLSAPELAHLPLPASSLGAVLPDLGRQFIAQRPVAKGPLRKLLG